MADATPIVTPPISRSGLLFRLLLQSDPYHAQLYRSSVVAAAVAEQLRRDNIDLIYCHFLYSAQYLPRSVGVPVCVDPHNVDREYWSSKVAAARGLRRLVTVLNRNRVCRYERKLLDRFQAYVCVSNDDRRITQEYASPPVPHVLTAPNGVDARAFAPAAKPPPDATTPLTLGFLGSLDVPMNVASVRRFYGQVWPHLCQALAPRQTRLLLIGRNPDPSLIRLTRGDPGVVYSGTVPDVRPWLAQLDIFVAPLVEGAGTKLKTLEAMAMGLPVVGTPLAFLGLGGESGRHFHCAGDDRAFVAAIADLAASPARRQQMGTAARAYVETRFSWDCITDRLAHDLSRCFGLRLASASPP